MDKKGKESREEEEARFSGRGQTSDYFVAIYLTCAASSLLAMACLALIRASSLRAALSTLPNSKSKPCEHWPARCMHPGVGPWPLARRENTNERYRMTKRDNRSSRDGRNQCDNHTWLLDLLSDLSFAPELLQWPVCPSALSQRTAPPPYQLRPE